MWFFANPLAYIVYACIGFWFLLVWIPHRIHVMRLGFKYGWPSEKHAAIIKLFREGELTSIGYLGVNNNPKGECLFQISGTWGQYTKLTVGDNDLITVPGCDQPPPEVMSAFTGYIHQASDVPYLLSSMSFIEALRKAVPDVVTSNIWDLGNFAIYKKGCPFILEVESGSPEENTALLIPR